MESFPTLLLHTARICGFTANIPGSIKDLWSPRPQDAHLEFKGLQHTQRTPHWNEGNCSYRSCSFRDQKVFHAHGCRIGSTERTALRMGTKRITRRKMQYTWSCTTQYGRSCNTALHVGRQQDDLPLPSTATGKSQLLSTKYNHWSSKLFFNCSFNTYLSWGRVCCTPALFSLKQSMSFISALVSEDKEQMASFISEAAKGHSVPSGALRRALIWEKNMKCQYCLAGYRILPHVDETNPSPQLFAYGCFKRKGGTNRNRMKIKAGFSFPLKTSTQVVPGAEKTIMWEYAQRTAFIIC